MKVLMTPHINTLRDDASGIARVVEAYFRYLPAHGIELVPPDATTYDLKAVHAGTAPDADVAHLHGIYWTADYTASAYEWGANAAVIDSARHARAVTVPSHWVAETFQRDMRFTPTVVGHGIEWDEWAHHKEPEEGYVLWNKNRRGDVCDPRWVAVLANRYLNMHFLTTFAPHNVSANVRITGVVPFLEMKRLIQRCSIYLATTKETFGIGILEAMASGKPILGFAHGGILDLVEHGVNGYLAKPNDVEDLIAGLRYCVDHAKTLGENGRDLAKEWVWDAAAEKIARVYQDAAHPDPPTAAVVIPCYNYGDKVRRAIESAVNQDYAQLTDIVVVDDGSPDDGKTQRVVAEWTARDPRVRYIRQENGGVARARNTGIANVSTKYIIPLDADDAIAPTFISTCIPDLEADTGLGVAYTGLWYIKPNGDEGLSPWPTQWNYDLHLQKQCQIPTCCVFRRKMWERLGGYRSRYCPCGAGEEDAEFWLRSGAYGWKAKKVTDDGLFLYSWLSGRVSGDKQHTETDWRAWHPWVRDQEHPFASYATPMRQSHAVRQYDRPLVSIIIPVGPGHEKLIVDALDSLEAQTFRYWEAIVVNDSGRPLDLTPFPYVRLIETDGKRGAGYARNRGIEAIRSELFVCLDADDFLQPDALAALLHTHWDNQDAWIYCDMYILHFNGTIEQYETEDWNIETLWRKGIAPVTCLYTKEQWDSVGGYDEQSTREDWEFHLRLAKHGYCGERIPFPMFTYRHATGKRRDEGSIRKEARNLHEQYDRRELTMACSGCKKRRRGKAAPQPVPPNENWELKEEMEEWVLVEYLGTSGDFLVRGRTSPHRYMFGANVHHRRNKVAPEDLSLFTSKAYFRVVSQTEAPPPSMLQAEPAPQIEPEPMPEPVQEAAPVQAAPVLPLPIEAEVEEDPIEQPAWAPPVRPQPKAQAPPPPPERVASMPDSGNGPVRPDVEVSLGDIRSKTVMAIMSIKDELTTEEWEAWLYDEETRTDRKPRETVIKWCKQRIRNPASMHEGA